MFNGIIKNTGIVKYIKKNIKSMNITVYTDLKIGNNMVGSSISCDGVCLTLISKKNKLLRLSKSICQSLQGVIDAEEDKKNAIKEAKELEDDDCKLP